ncbi:MAG: glycosyltransferase family 4 protein [Planctomycetaceae bacterium]|jgi:UDP-glucose:(heptosyl)LPS alpha-1,3-glucosyltransferase|nr:glycosyltransferase family 4 protein [Planctomycetaceae bacterium]
MRIALVKQRYSLRHGGSERYCVVLARRLQAAGHDVTVIVEKIDDELRNEVDFIPVRVNRITSWTRSRSFAENGGKAAAEGQFDLVYGLGRSFGLDAVRVTERLQSHWLNVYYRNPLNRALQGLNPRHRTLIDLERTIYNSDHVRRVVTQSQLDRRLVIEHYGIPEEKICTIYNGVDIGVFHPGLRVHGTDVRSELRIDPDVPLLLFASMDFEGKGLRSIFHALEASKQNDARLLVLGTGPARKFQRLANHLGIGERIIFGGRRSGIERFFGASDLFILPTAYEPFPNVNLEAMACGTPVMTTRTAGTADMVDEGRNGYLISDMYAVDEMTAGIDRHVLLSQTDRQAMAEACWETAQNLTIERNIQQTLKMLEGVHREKLCA